MNMSRIRFYAITLAALAVTVCSIIAYRHMHRHDELKWILRVNALPSVIEIHDGHDHWTDIVCCYYIKLRNPDDMVRLTSGWKFELENLEEPHLVESNFITPAKVINAKRRHFINDKIYNLSIFVSDDNVEAIVKFSQD